MKRFFSLLLTLLMLLSLCACGGASGAQADSNNAPTDTENTTPKDDTQTEKEEPAPEDNSQNGNEEPAPEEPEEKEEPITAESVAGTYSARMWFFDDSFTLNANTTYDYRTGEKGTFSISNNKIHLIPRYSSDDRKDFTVNENSLYIGGSWRFTKDEDYGLAFSPAENGYTDQTFTACVLNSAMPGSRYNWIALVLKSDGAFEIRLGFRGYSSLDIVERFEGTYISNESSIVLTYEGQEYIMLLSEDNAIYFVIYDKE